MPLTVSFKLSGSGGSTFSLDLEPSMTILDVKNLAKDKCSIEAAQMKIIYKGRILKDEETLESHKVESGNTMHVVKSAPSAGTPAEGGAATTPAATPAAAPAPAATPAAAPMGGADPMAGLGGLGGMGGMGGMDPAMIQQMLQNPMIQQMMQNLSQNPQMLQQMIQNNPMLQQMAQRDPMFAQMVQNPQMMQAMFNPQMLQAITQMQTAMQGAAPPAGGVPAPGATTPAAVPPNPMGGMDPAMMQAAMQAMMGGGMGGMGGLPGAGGMGAPPAANDGRPAEERFASQLEQLAGMGFTDRPSNIQALQMANGDVNQAINFLIGG